MPMLQIQETSKMASLFLLFFCLAMVLTEDAKDERSYHCNKCDQAFGETLTNQNANISSLTAELSSLKSRLQSLESGATFDQGSTFVRWGRKSCPVNTTLVYAGIAGGKRHNQTGSGTNMLCLTKTPRFDGTAIPVSVGHLYGAEYQQIPFHHDHDVPCVVCRAPQSTTIMVPATLICPSGWKVQYDGHLGSQRDILQATEYVCLDKTPENEASGVGNKDGLLFYYVIAKCGSLPCPPYAHNRVVTCVVCSR